MVEQSIMRSKIEISRLKFFSAILLLLLGAALSAFYFVTQFHMMNWVTITVLGNPKVEDVTITVGTNKLVVGAMYPGYKYKYAFRSPGEGSIGFSGKVNDELFRCEIGYVDTYTASKSLIEISDQPGVSLYSGPNMAHPLVCQRLLNTSESDSN